jgi:hypothetical protein
MYRCVTTQLYGRLVGRSAGYALSGFVNRSHNCYNIGNLAHSNLKQKNWAVNFATACEVPAPPTSNHKYTPLTNAKGSVLYTETDEAPALATYSLYPLISKASS